MKKDSQNVPEPNPWGPVEPAVYTAAEMAILLRISEWMVYERAKTGEIPRDAILPFGSQKRFIKSVINKWLGIAGDQDERAAS